MRHYPSDIAFTPTVKGIQTEKGSRASYAKVERRGWRTRVTPDLAEFLAGLDMFYLGTASAEGQPYIQHRGGSPGFLKVLDERTLAFADFSGNRQYITLGNLFENPKAFIFLMDYANQQRVKLWGTAKVVEDDVELLERLRAPDYPGKVERAIVFTIEAWDINCPQHIQKRFSQRQVQPVIEQLQRRISELEAQLAQQAAHEPRPRPLETVNFQVASARFRRSPRDDCLRQSSPSQGVEHDVPESNASHSEHRRSGHLLQGGGSEGGTDDPAAARLPDLLAYVPQPDPGPGRRVPLGRPGLSWLRL